MGATQESVVAAPREYVGELVVLTEQVGGFKPGAVAQIVKDDGGNGLSLTLEFDFGQKYNYATYEEGTHWEVLQDMTAQLVFKAGIQREPGWLYYFDNGNIMRTRMVSGGQKKKPGDKPEVVLKTDVKREDGFIYYLDKHGDVRRAEAFRGGYGKVATKTVEKPASKPVVKKSPPETTIVGASMGFELQQKRLKSGNFTSYIKGTKILHCEDGPAEITKHATGYFWFGREHRIDGPAIENKDGFKGWYFLGMSHNLSGPATVYSDGTAGDYCIFNNYMNKKEYDQLVGNSEFMKRAKKIEQAMLAAFSDEEPATIEDKSVKVKKKSSSSLLPMLALGLGAGGLAFAGKRLQQKMNKEKAVPMKVK